MRRLHGTKGRDTATLGHRQKLLFFHICTEGSWEVIEWAWGNIGDQQQLREGWRPFSLYELLSPVKAAKYIIYIYIYVGDHRLRDGRNEPTRYDKTVSGRRLSCWSTMSLNTKKPLLGLRRLSAVTKQEVVGLRLWHASVDMTLLSSVEKKKYIKQTNWTTE